MPCDRSSVRGGHDMMNCLAYSRNFVLIFVSFIIMQANDAFPEPANPSPAGLVGWIHVEPRSEGDRQILTLSGWALATSPMNGTYILAVRKWGKAGASNNSQSGHFAAALDGPVKLSQTAVNITPADLFEIDLRLSVDGREVFHASLKSAGAASP
jgi:hypothetical protein